MKIEAFIDRPSMTERASSQIFGLALMAVLSVCSY